MIRKKWDKSKEYKACRFFLSLHPSLHHSSNSTLRTAFTIRIFTQLFDYMNEKKKRRNVENDIETMKKAKSYRKSII